MTTSTNYCKQCGARLAIGVRFCEDCGAAVQVGAGQDNATFGVSAVPSRTVPVRGNRPAGWIRWLAAGAVLFALCCLLITGTALLFPDVRQAIGLKGFPLPVAEKMMTLTATAMQSGANNTAEVKPAVTLIATVMPSMLPTATIEPTVMLQPSPTLFPTIRSTQIFTDDFSSSSTGWPQLNDSTRMTGYSEGGMYGIALKQPGSDGDILIPHGFDLPLNTVELSFRARPVGGSGYFGVECSYIDENNYLFIGISEGAYTIAKNENGTFTSFFNPFWLHDPAIVNENHEFQVLVKCGDDKIQLMINGYTLPAVDYTGMAGGDVLIAVSSTKNAVQDGLFYYEVLFDDLELKAR